MARVAWIAQSCEARGVSITKRGTRSYLVRVEPFPARTLRTKEDAERVELDLKRRKALGEHYEARPITLGEAMDGTLARLRVAGNPSVSWMALNELASKAWEPLRAHRVSALRRATIEDMTQERGPRSAGSPQRLSWSS